MCRWLGWFKLRKEPVVIEIKPHELREVLEFFRGIKHQLDRIEQKVGLDMSLGQDILD